MEHLRKRAGELLNRVGKRAEILKREDLNGSNGKSKLLGLQILGVPVSSPCN